jgi:ferrous iron transport protein A
MPDMVPLKMLACGQAAVVRQIVGRLEQVRRLEELGLRGGAQLEMVRAGTPCIVRLAGTTLCFRDSEQLSVLVAPRMSA